MNDFRDADIRAAVERRRVDETKIMQKVNAANREAFVTKFPTQAEHIMRLISERLMNCLNKPDGTDLSDPDTWPASTEQILNLTQALFYIDQVRDHWSQR